jgi:hypothetical protein
MKATSRRSFENLSSLFLAIFIFLQGGAVSAQPVNARPPGFSNAPAAGFSNAQLGRFFHFYHFTPIADAQGGFPFQNILGPPSINSDGVIAYHAILTGGVEGVSSNRVRVSMTRSRIRSSILTVHNTNRQYDGE